MKSILIVFMSLGIAAASFLGISSMNNKASNKGCVFNTVFGVEEIDSTFDHAIPEEVLSSLDRGIEWLKNAQQQDGGWGAGSHSRQNVNDPHAVQTDPATTAMVAMALLRNGIKYDKGNNSKLLKDAAHYLLDAVKTAPGDGSNITTLTNTQIQSKLGGNIDLILTSQFLSNLFETLDKDSKIGKDVFSAINKCVDKIQLNQDKNGSFKGAGWAGVLQSSLANNALEFAQSQGAWVNEDILKKSRDYQTKNYDTESNEVKTIDGAGIVLYSVSGSVRANAKEAREALQIFNKAKDDGLLEKEEEMSRKNLEKIGIDGDQALRFSTAYNVYQSAKTKAQRDDVMAGFGNNGGEEFLSFLQTGESLVINKDEEWKQWFDNISGRLMQIQNEDGSWNGHHCITSPVFCTAACALILSINNDVDNLIKMGGK